MPTRVRSTAASLCKDHGWRVTIEKPLRAEMSDEDKHLAQIIAFANPSLSLNPYRLIS